MVAFTGWGSRTTGFCIGPRMRGVILKTVQVMESTSGKTLSMSYGGSLKCLW